MPETSEHYTELNETPLPPSGAELAKILIATQADADPTPPEPAKRTVADHLTGRALVATAHAAMAGRAQQQPDLSPEAAQKRTLRNRIIGGAVATTAAAAAGYHEARSGVSVAGVMSTLPTSPNIAQAGIPILPEEQEATLEATKAAIRSLHSKR